MRPRWRARLRLGRKKSTKIKFLGPETARWGGGLPREGVVAEKFVPGLESQSSLGFEERNLGCPGNFAGMSRTPGGFQKVCAKKVRAHFLFPIRGRTATQRSEKGSEKVLGRVLEEGSQKGAEKGGFALGFVGFQKVPRTPPPRERPLRRAPHESRLFLTLLPCKARKNFTRLKKGEAFLLTVKLLCLQSLKALLRRTFPL